MTADTTKQILNTIEKLKKASVIDIVKNLPEKKSRQWVSTLLNKLTNNNKLLRAKFGRYVFYVLPKNKDLLSKSVTKKLINKDLQEDQVLEKIRSEVPFLSSQRENVDSIIYYAFTEMLNNAIEHSNSKSISIKMESMEDKLSFEIIDRGIGAFKNIMQVKKMDSELDAIQELLKGKTTTLPHSHSGEGIFFTSKIADVFILDSFGYRLRVDNTINDIFIEEIKNNIGTKVRFEIQQNSNKHLSEVFKEYQSKAGSFSFDKTKVHIKLYIAGTVYISRSQARRLLLNLNKYKVIVLDFKGIKTIGQAFADEIFRVFSLKYPKIEIRPINMNQTVSFMIDRVRKH